MPILNCGNRIRFLDKQKQKRNEELRKIIGHVIDDYHKTRFGIEHTFALVVGRF